MLRWLGYDSMYVDPNISFECSIKTFHLWYIYWSPIKNLRETRSVLNRVGLSRKLAMEMSNQVVVWCPTSMYLDIFYYTSRRRTLVHNYYMHLTYYWVIAKPTSSENGAMSTLKTRQNQPHSFSQYNNFIAIGPCETICPLPFPHLLSRRLVPY